MILCCAICKGSHKRLASGAVERRDLPVALIFGLFYSYPELDSIGTFLTRSGLANPFSKVLSRGFLSPTR